MCFLWVIWLFLATFPNLLNGGYTHTCVIGCCCFLNKHMHTFFFIAMLNYPSNNVSLLVVNYSVRNLWFVPLLKRNCRGLAVMRQCFWKGEETVGTACPVLPHNQLASSSPHWKWLINLIRTVVKFSVHHTGTNIWWTTPNLQTKRMQCQLRLCITETLNLLVNVHVYLTGGDSLVSSSWSSARIDTVFMSNWHVVHWVHLCWNGNKETTLSGWFRDWPIVSHIQVIMLLFLTIMTIFMIYTVCCHHHHQ